MNKILGQIILKESGNSIPNLLVAVYDLDPGTKPEEIFGGSGSTGLNLPAQGIPGDRLGSVLTDENGAFVFTFEDKEFQIRNRGEKRPDLFIFVLAPEEFGKSLVSRILYFSTVVRQNAGRIESYLIRLTEEQLKKADVQIPAEEEQDPDEIIKRIEASEKIKETVASGIHKINVKKVEKIREKTLEFNKKIKPHLLKALSGVPEDIATSGSFVVQGESVKKKTNTVIKRGIETVINVANDPKVRAPVVGHISLTEEQKTILADQAESIDHEGNLVNVPGEIVESVVRNRNVDRQRLNPTFLLREDPISKLCREKTLGERCLEDEDGSDEDLDDDNDNENNGTEETGAGVESATSDDVPKYVASLIEAMTAPEAPIAFGVTQPEKRADQSTVQRNIDAFSLKSGPADTPAFYDFHNLQIAFEHVWQESIDEGILKLGEDAYREIVGLGGDPCSDTFGVIPGAVVDYVGCFNREAENAERAYNEEPPYDVIKAFEVTREQWSVLNGDYREKLKKLSFTALRPFFGVNARKQGERILKYADSLLASEYGPFNRLHKILIELNQRIKEDYPFTIYAANRQERSVNFGALVTYRQKWVPINYQVGELIKTITLAPKEVRKFSKKIVIKKKRAEKEVENSLSIKKDEASETSRAEDVIIRKALSKTNFSLTAEGEYNAGAWKGKGTTKLGKDAQTTSEETKKDFREAIFKATQEYKQERKIEINTEESFDEELSESGEISNPNDELAVTFLYYELQRRYRVSEQIHRLTPVVLVAQEVPKPHEIDEEWLIAHDWILRRVILDDTFIPALTYLSTQIVGDEASLKELRKNVEKHRSLVDVLKEEIVVIRQQVGQRYAALESSIGRRADIVESEDQEGLLDRGNEWLNGSDDESVDAARIREDAAKDAYERAAKQEKEMLSRLEREVTALNAITESYTKMLSKHLNQKTQISRLRVHIKQNILYYMQAIWNHEPPDQRFFRLHKVHVPAFEKESSTYTISNTSSPWSFAGLPHNSMNGEFANPHGFTVNTEINPDFETVSLVEVADLDNLLGFKGNYMIFPLKESNPLTDFMMEPYIDKATGELIDPDPIGNMNLDDFAKYVCCLKKELTEDRFEEFKPQLRELIKTLLTSPLRSGEDLIVPTGSLYIEALPAAHPLLEDFKLMHRAIDVKKVQAEVREMEMENIRAAARLLNGEREDPNIDKKIVVEGNSPSLSLPLDDN